MEHIGTDINHPSVTRNVVNEDTGSLVVGFSANWLLNRGFNCRSVINDGD